MYRHAVAMQSSAAIERTTGRSLQQYLKAFQIMVRHRRQIRTLEQLAKTSSSFPLRVAWLNQSMTLITLLAIHQQTMLRVHCKSYTITLAPTIISRRSIKQGLSGVGHYRSKTLFKRMYEIFCLTNTDRKARKAGQNPSYDLERVQDLSPTIRLKFPLDQYHEVQTDESESAALLRHLRT